MRDVLIVVVVLSNLSAFPYVAERSEATPGLWNQPFSVLSGNIAVVDQTLSLGQFQQLSIGSTPPSYLTTAAVTIEVNSAFSDYLYLVDSSAQKSSYIIGSRAGGTADGLNIWDVSGATMIASFSKQSIRFFQNVVGPVFDVGGALADTLNAATFGSGADSDETRIQAAISAATNAVPVISRVYIPANMYPYNADVISFDSRVQMIREGGSVAVYDVRAYGATDGVYAHSSFQAAAAAAVKAQGGVVFFPPGFYQLQSAISLGASDSYVIFQGSGRDVSHIAIPAATPGKELFHITGANTSTQIRDLWLGSFSAQTNGYGLRIEASAGAASQFIMERCTFQNLPTPVYIDNITQSRFADVRYLQSIANATVGHVFHMIRCNGAIVLDQFVVITTAGTLPSDVIRLDSDNDSILLSRVQLTNLGNGVGTVGFHCLNSTGGASTGPRLIRFTDCQVEGAGGGGWLIDAARDIRLTGCHAAINGLHGFSITGGDSIAIVNSFALNNDRHGVSVTGGKGVIIAGSSFVNNSFSVNNTYDGISVESGTSGIVLAGNRAGNFIFPAAANKQRSGISVAGSTDYISLVDNDVQGNVTVGMFSASTGVNNFWADSSNVTTSSGGTLSMRSGAIIGNTLLVGGEVPNGGEILRTTSHARFTGYAIVTGSNAMMRLDNRNSSGSSVLGIFNQAGTEIRFGNATTNQDYAYLSQLSFTPSQSTGTSDLGSIGRPWYRAVLGQGTAIAPASTFSSEQSLGWFRSGNSALALSYGTLDLTASGAVTSIASLTIKSGSNNACGTAVLGSNGSVNVANTYVKTGDLIFLTDQTPGGTLGDLELLGIRNSSGFTIGSTSITDTSTVAWLIIRPG